jgi:hypothetical protein
MKITAEQFKAATGMEPQDDDLARCNCPYAGNPGHFFCGWDKQQNKPRFMCDPVEEQK